MIDRSHDGAEDPGQVSTLSRLRNTVEGSSQRAVRNSYAKGGPCTNERLRSGNPGQAEARACLVQNPVANEEFIGNREM